MGSLLSFLSFSQMSLHWSSKAVWVDMELASFKLIHRSLVWSPQTLLRAQWWLTGVVKKSGFKLGTT